jgi:hypothetical protein
MKTRPLFWKKESQSNSYVFFYDSKNYISTWRAVTHWCLCCDKMWFVGPLLFVFVKCCIHRHLHYVQFHLLFLEWMDLSERQILQKSAIRLPDKQMCVHFTWQTRPLLNSLIAKSVPVGTKNSHSDCFWLAKHKDTNISTMMEPFSPPAAWFCWPSVSHPRAPLRRRPWGFSRINKQQEKIIHFYSLSVNYNNRSTAVGNDSQNGIHCCRRVAII